MGLFNLVLLLLAVAFLCYAINRWAPISIVWKKWIIIIIVVIVAMYLLTNVLHIIPLLNTIKVGG